MAEEEKPQKEHLNGYDYLHMPIPELADHPEFSGHAMEIVNAVMSMNTEQLERLDVVKAKNGT